MRLRGEEKPTNISRSIICSTGCRRMVLVLSGFCLLLLLAGCNAASTLTTIPSSTSTIAPHPPEATFTPAITPILTSTPLPSPSSPLEPVATICSPLAGIELDDLHSITSQAFSAPTAFQDDGHPAVDLAFFTFEDLPSMFGHPVQAILPGEVVMVLEDRFPYGSMILIETPLEWLSDKVLPAGSIPTPVPEENINLFSPCANDPLYEGMSPVAMSTETRSLYVLYSHLLEKPAYESGDRVNCGEVIGAVGLTGNTVAEHLHLEMRIGPSDAKFNSFAMYKPDATIEERYYYCSWSTSGRFQPIDPAQFWDNIR